MAAEAEGFTVVAAAAMAAETKRVMSKAGRSSRPAFVRGSLLKPAFQITKKLKTKTSARSS
jgi:hypothetical protein